MTGNARPRRRERQTESPRRHRVNLAYNSDELMIVKEAAARSNMAPTAWAARAALDVAKEVVVPVSADAKDVLQEVIQSRAQLARVGNNLNQVAHVLNADGTVPTAQLASVLVLVEEAVRRIDAATVQLMRERRPRS